MKRIILSALAIMALWSSSVSCIRIDVTPESSLPLFSVSIIPDFSDGSVYSCSDDGSFFLRVSVTPKRYLDEFANNGKYIYRADFRKVITKASNEAADFSAIGEITVTSVEEGYMTASFVISKDDIDKLDSSKYMVSFSIEDKNGTHGAATGYIPVSFKRIGEGGGEREDAINVTEMTEGDENW